MALVVASLFCPFTTASDNFTLMKDTTNTHFNNVGFNVLDNAPLAIYQVALAEHWLIMGLKTDSSPIDVWLSKMEAAIENIVFLMTTSNLAVN
jgi:hypothetical protein